MSRRSPVVATRAGRALTAAKAHPAPYSAAHILAVTQLLTIARAGLVDDGERMRVIDVMGGIGNVHLLDPTHFDTLAVELEQCWVDVARKLYPGRRTVQGNATKLTASKLRRLFHACFVSPTFGNRYSDHHDNRDTCKACQGTGCAVCWGFGVSMRRSYHHDAQRLAGPGYRLDPDNTGLLKATSPRYAELHEAAWAAAFGLLVDGGLMLVDVKDHTANGATVEVVDMHRRWLKAAGFEAVTEVPIEADSYRNGANSEARASHHVLLVYRRPELTP